jgi:GT2 family glycosyltransferase
VTAARPAGRRRAVPRALAPRPVVDIDLDLDGGMNPPVIRPGPAPAGLMLVFWSCGIPVGELVVPGTSLPRASNGAEVAAARHRAAGRSGAGSPDAGSGADDVTVVICTRDRPEGLARCLSALGRSTAPPGDIIVVDNAPTSDATRRLVAATPGFRYVHEPRPGLDIARNAGLAAARTDIVAYTDDDAEPHPDWTWRIRQAFEGPSVVAVTGLVLPAELDTQAQVLFEDHAGFGRGYDRRDFGPEFLAGHRRSGAPVWEIGAGANMAFRRTAVEAVGGFDERLDVGAAGCSGDSEIWYRLLASGGRCRYDPAAVVRHHHRRELEALRRQMYFYLRGHACALLVQFERHRDRGNLRRLLLVLPAWYARSAGRTSYRRLRGIREPADVLLLPQMRGWLAGILYYLRTRLTG